MSKSLAWWTPALFDCTVRRYKVSLATFKALPQKLPIVFFALILHGQQTDSTGQYLDGCVLTIKNRKVLIHTARQSFKYNRMTCSVMSLQRQRQMMNLLSIGGSDPSSGAGIQSDIKAFSELGAYGLTVITAVTSQNTSVFKNTEPVSQKMLKSQLESVLADFEIDGIKIGMVYNSETIKTLHRQLKKLEIPIIVDPVIKSTTGGRLLKVDALKDFQKYIIPLATVITPNRFEAEVLSGIKISSKNTIQMIAKDIQKMGAKNVLITGIKDKDNRIADYILEKDTACMVSSKMVGDTNHGSGCSYSAAMTFAISEKRTVKESAEFAKEFAYNSIKNAKKVGKGISIVNGSATAVNTNAAAVTTTTKDKTVQELSQSIDKFVRIKDIHKNIPECQTNFVYSKQRPKTTRDILGLSGRIVRAGNEVIVAGSLAYGGSKHVATALLVVNKKFSGVRSAVNLKYKASTISIIKGLELVVSSYDRVQEPGTVKKNGSSIEWGIKNAVKNLESPPDIIFHTGDVGKEPMIIVFGDTPKDVLKKTLMIVR